MKIMKKYHLITYINTLSTFILEAKILIYKQKKTRLSVFLRMLDGINLYFGRIKKLKLQKWQHKLEPALLCSS